MAQTLDVSADMQSEVVEVGMIQAGLGCSPGRIINMLEGGKPLACYRF